MKNELHVSLRRIAEDGFTRNDEILADASKALTPQMGFELLSDIKKNLLTITARVAYATAEKEIAVALSFRYTLEVNSLSDLEHTTNPQQGTHQYRFPNGFIEAVLTDVYATARILMMQKLVGTRLENTYLPFGGASNLIRIMQRKKK